MKKILFIGNSHTYMNDMPEIAREMFESATDEECEVFMLAYSNRTLKWHMDEEYFAVRFNILHGGYDYCVIQEKAHPMTSFEDTEEYAGKIMELCKKAGTVPVIFETWAERKKPEDQEEMNRRYRKIAAGTGAILAPVGEVWEEVLKEEAVPDLFFTDGQHASFAGDYLAAMVIVKAITGKAPEKGFLKSFDFSLHQEGWQPVKEDVDDEMMQLDEEAADVILKHVTGVQTDEDSDA